MLSYTNLLNYYKEMTDNLTTGNATNGAVYLNQAIRDICNKREWSFLEATETTTTTASTQSYALPYDFKKMINCYATVSSTNWIPTPVNNKNDWDILNQTSVLGDTFDYYYLYNNRILFYPIPATSSNTITFNYKKTIKDIGTADYITGTITMTNGSATVTGSGTTFTSAMVGRYIKATNDGYWYKISAYVSATEITLEKTFEGTTSGSLAFTIGEMPVLPDGYEMLAVYKACIIYWSYKDPERVNRFVELYKELYQDLVSEYGSKDTSILVNEMTDLDIINPNLTITA